jgi:hypothetical protein
VLFKVNLVYFAFAQASGRSIHIKESPVKSLWFALVIALSAFVLPVRAKMPQQMHSALRYLLATEAA